MTQKKRQSFFNCCSSTAVSISPYHSPLPHTTPPPTLCLTPLWICPCVRYICSVMTLPLFLLLSPPLSLLVTATLFFTSMSLVIFCLLAFFVDQVSLIGEIIWYLSFTAWLITLSIILSSSIHEWQELLLSFCCVVFHCVNVPVFYGNKGTMC